jgi:hypothetical protein
MDSLVAEFMRDGVIYVGVVGEDCARVEDIIDELKVGDGTREPYLAMLTASHPGQTIAQAVEFAESLTGEFKGDAHVIDLSAGLQDSGAPNR